MVIISVLIFILPECVESVVKEFRGRCNFVFRKRESIKR